MYVNKVPLLVTLSRNIKFGMMEAEGSDAIEMHQGSSCPIPEGRVQGDHRTHGR